MDAEAYYQEKCREIVETRSWTAQELEKLGFTVLPSDANFLFAKTDKMDGGKLYEALKERGILVRHFRKEIISQYNRITIGTRAEMEVFVETLRSILGGTL